MLKLFSGHSDVQLLADSMGVPFIGQTYLSFSLVINFFLLMHMIFVAIV